MELLTRSDPSNFGNTGWPGGERPPSSFDPPVPEVWLRRVMGEKTRLGRTRRVEVFELLEPITYRARLGREAFTITVPQPSGRFTTDFTSVPALFTWLVPKSGEHLPAAIIHDGLVPDRGDTEPTYTLSDTGGTGRTSVDRIDADTVFRDAMRDTGVGRVRRWLVWAAVTTASLYLGPRADWRPHQRLYYWLVPSLTFLLIAWLGAAATADLLDAPGPWWWGALPWIPEGGPVTELVHGAAGAIVVPLLMSVAWLRYWRAGAIAGVALATLIHVTVAVALVAGLYWAAEAVLGRSRGSQWALVAGVLVAALLFLGSLL